MNKGTHFLGQPMYGQLISLLDKAQILRISQENGGERYVKHFDAWQHLVVMLYAVVKRFDSLREIVASMLPEARKLGHLGINAMPRRSTLSDANLRRNECIFEAIYGELYATYKHVLSADSRRRGCPKWIEHNWSFSNLATMVRIMLMYYIDCYSFFEHPEKDWLKILDTYDNPPAEPSLFD